MKTMKIFGLFFSMLLLTSILGLAQGPSRETKSSTEFQNPTPVSILKIRRTFEQFGIDLIPMPDGKVAAVCNFKLVVGLENEFPVEEFEKLKLSRVYICSGHPCELFIKSLENSCNDLDYLAISSHEISDVDIGRILKCSSANKLSIDRANFSKEILDELSREKFPVVWIASSEEMRKLIRARQDNPELPETSALMLLFTQETGQENGAVPIKRQKKGDAAH